MTKKVCLLGGKVLNEVQNSDLKGSGGQGETGNLKGSTSIHPCITFSLKIT